MMTSLTAAVPYIFVKTAFANGSAQLQLDHIQSRRNFLAASTYSGDEKSWKAKVGFDP